jgi:excisionase family DNA binding protein
VARVSQSPAVERVRMPKRRPFVGDRLLTVGEVAGTMRVSNMTVYRLIKAGQLAAIRVGKNYRIRESDVNRYLSERSVKVEREQ